MESHYKQILERRKQGLLDGITWTKDFSKWLVKHGLFSRDAVIEIEMDANKRNRVYLMLAKLPQLSAPHAFHWFCKVLQDSGHDDLADMLAYDRGNLTWDDFDNGLSIPTPSDYVEVIEDLLLQRHLTEEDEYIGSLAAKEMKKRLNKLSRYLTHEVRRKRKMRENLNTLLTKVDPIEVDLPTMDLHDGLDLLLEQEEGLDGHLWDSLAQEMELLVDQNWQLQGQVNRPRVSRQLSSTPTPMCNHKDVDVLKDTIRRQDEEISLLKRKLQEHENTILNHRAADQPSNMAVAEYLQVSEQEYEEIVSMLSKYLKRSSVAYFHANKESRVEHGSSILDMLQEYTRAVSGQVERMRKRVNETSDSIMQLEREKELILSYLDRQDSDGQVSKLVKAKIDEMKTVNRKLEEKIKSLYEKLASSSSDSDEEVFKKKPSVVSKVKCSHTSNGSPRVRKVSVPSAPRPLTPQGKPSPTKAPVKARRITVTGAPPDLAQVKAAGNIASPGSLRKSLVRQRTTPSVKK